MKITKSKIKQIVEEELTKIFEDEENNPWAICTASVGRDDKKKYERCVNKVKKEKK